MSRNHLQIIKLVKFRLMSQTNVLLINTHKTVIHTFCIYCKKMYLCVHMCVCQYVRTRVYVCVCDREIVCACVNLCVYVCVRAHPAARVSLQQIPPPHSLRAKVRTDWPANLLGMMVTSK